MFTGLEAKPYEREAVVGYVYSQGVPELLAELGISLLVSTYQAQRVLLLSSNGRKLSMLMRCFDRPTGLAFDGQTLALYAKYQVWFFENIGTLNDANGKPLPYDACFSPRRSPVCGDIFGHELAFLKGDLLAVNTRFSCISKLSPAWSFEAIWQPPFISELAPEDRCHLNGFVVSDAGPLYASALGLSNTREGWRTDKAKGGILMHIPSGEIVTQGLAMPHSPRLYQGQLYILESGCGALQKIDPKSGARETIIALPGYLRGLAFFGKYALVGTCKIREKSTFGGVPIEKNVSELKCSIHIIDLSSAQSVGFIEFTKGIEELFDILVFSSWRNPHLIGFAEDTINGIYKVPGA